MRFALVATEPSGDSHGAQLHEALVAQGDSCIGGLGGKKLAAQGLKSLFPLEEIAVMGFSDVLSAFPRLYKRFYQLVNFLLQQSPDLILCIDSAAWNLRLAKALRTRGFKGKIVQYICPAVWAWGKERIEWLEKYFDLLLTIYPFEPPLFAHTRLPTFYVGSPVVISIPQKPTYPRSNTLLLLPGSRTHEVTRHLPLMKRLAKTLGCPTVICTDIPCDPDQRPADEAPFWMDQAAYALAKSGTVSLELALHQCPSLILYKLTTLNRLLAEYWFKIHLPFYTLPNLLLQREIFPEQISHTFKEKSLLKALDKLLALSPHFFAEADHALRQLLGDQHPHIVAVQHIKERL